VAALVRQTVIIRVVLPTELEPAVRIPSRRQVNGVPQDVDQLAGRYSEVPATGSAGGNSTGFNPFQHGVGGYRTQPRCLTGG